MRSILLLTLNLSLAVLPVSCARSPSRPLADSSEAREAAPVQPQSVTSKRPASPPLQQAAPLRMPERSRANEPRVLSLAQRLRATKVPSYRLEGVTSLREALAPLAQLADVPIHVTAEAEEAVQDAGVVFDLDLASSRSVRSVLNLVFEFAGDEVDWTVRHGVVYATTFADARELVLRRYDLRGATAGVVSSSPPPIGQLGVSGWEPEEEFNTRERVETGLSADTIVDLVRDNVDPESWDLDGASLRLVGGILFVRNTEEVQARVQKLLAQFGI